MNVNTDLDIYSIPQLKFFPKRINIPDNNPMTIEGINLGRHLFYDGRLSGTDHPDSLRTCSSCHIQSRGFGSNIKLVSGKGYPCGLKNGREGKTKYDMHVTLPLTNLIYNSNGYFWNGLINVNNNQESQIEGIDLKNLESIVWISIVSQDCINSDTDRLLALIKNDMNYRILFNKAFGSTKITQDRICKAISQFVRSILSYRFKFYNFYKGETVLSESEKRGYELFFSEETGCFHCHAGSLLMTTNQYYNNAREKSPLNACDRFAVTQHMRDRGAYRAPSLINVALNAPYMHDGRFESLDEVIDFYSEGVQNSNYADPLIKGLHEGGIHISAQQKSDLIAFLHTLTDHELLTDTTYSCPKSLGRFGIRHLDKVFEQK